MESKLRTWNLLAAAAHAAALVGFATAFARKDKARRLVSMHRAGADAGILSSGELDPCKSVDFPMTVKNVSQHDPARWLTAFFGVTVVAHLFYAWNPRGVYSRAVLDRGWNPFRWVEYGISAGIMSYLIAMLDGQRNRHAATLIAFATLTLNLQGLIVERSLRQNERWRYYSRHPLGRAGPQVDGAVVLTATVSAWLLLGVTWYTILDSFFKILGDAQAIADAAPAGDPQFKIPSFLYAVGFSQLAFFTLFGTLQGGQVRELLRERSHVAAGRPVSVTPFVNFEQRYIALSFLSKFVLASTVGYGLLRRTSVGTCP
jgi:hypothetical protein